MRRRSGLLGLGALLFAGCMGLREQRNLATESLRMPPGATANYRPQTPAPAGPRPGAAPVVPRATPDS